MIESADEFLVQGFMLQRAVKAFEKIVGVHDQIVVNEAMFPSQRPIGILPLGVDAGRHKDKQVAQAHAESVGLPTETALVDATVPRHKPLQGIIANAVFADIIEVTPGAEPVTRLFLPNPFPRDRRPMLAPDRWTGGLTVVTLDHRLLPTMIGGFERFAYTIERD